jgi:hypothetical protein
MPAGNADRRQYFAIRSDAFRLALAVLDLASNMLFSVHATST